jgi:hypothetical protein
MTNVFSTWISADRKYAISGLGPANPDKRDGFILVARDIAAAKTVVLGYGARGVSVKWFQTKAGDVAIIDHQTDNGMNELFVVLPRRIGKQTLWGLLYRTPDGWGTANEWTIAHCNWKVIKFDTDLGILRLSGSWDFSNATNEERRKLKTEGVYDIPMFYGAK